MALFKHYQKKLFPYAYNILGSVDDAMDVIQDVVTNYISSSKRDIENETGYLIKGVINQSINIKKEIKKPLVIRCGFQSQLQWKKQIQI